jgi:AcrR family transcriptional regulator
VTQTADPAAEPSPWSPRETELLAVTLQLLQEHGYDRLTVDAVAAKARASKATMYRRWPSKAELVLAAFIEGIRQVAVPPNTGTLRGDLLRMGELICQQGRQHAGTIRAVLVEVSRSPALNYVMQHQFIEQRRALMRHILQQAVDRGEIDQAAINDELWDLMPHYLIFRSIFPGRPPPPPTVPTRRHEGLIPSHNPRQGVAVRRMCTPASLVPSGSGPYCLSCRSALQSSGNVAELPCHRLSKG